MKIGPPWRLTTEDAPAPETPVLAAVHRYDEPTEPLVYHVAWIRPDGRWTALFIDLDDDQGNDPYLATPVCWQPITDPFQVAA